MLKINRMMLFCNLFMERPSYNKNEVDLYMLTLSQWHFLYNSELLKANKWRHANFQDSGSPPYWILAVQKRIRWEAHVELPIGR